MDSRPRYVNCRYIRAKRRIRNVNQMPVMSKEEDLRLPSKLRQDLKSCRRSHIVKIDEEVIGNEWERRRVAEEVLYGGHTQSQIELVGTATAHSRYWDFPVT